MAYEKQIWKDLPDETTPITAERMNHIENGISGVDTFSGNLQSEINNIRLALGLYTDNYDSAKTYAIGDMVTHNHAIYECTTAITTAEEWDSSHWTIVPIIVEEE